MPEEEGLCDDYMNNYEVSYLGENCPKCGSYRVLPVLDKYTGKIKGHCLVCLTDFTLTDEEIENLRRRLEAWRERR